MPRYSVVMPSFIRSEPHRMVAEQTIRSVKQNSEDYEFIIVDDGSMLSSGFLRKHADTYIRHNPSNKGIAPSWNDGKNVSRGEYVAIINDDIMVPYGWLDFMAQGFEREDCGVVGVSVAGPQGIPNVIGDANYALDHTWFSGYCFMLRKDRFFEDFDEQFVPFNFEDIDYWERIQNSELNMYKAPLSIWHAEGDTIHEMNYEETDNENLEKFIAKHGFNPKEKYFG